MTKAPIIRSSFSSSSGIFDTSVHLKVVYNGKWKKAIVALDDIGPLMECDEKSCFVFIKSLNQNALVNLPLEEVFAKFQKMDSATRIIDLMPADDAVSDAESELKAQFRAACESTGRGSFVMLHLYAADHDHPNDIGEALIKVDRYFAFEKRSSYPATRIFISKEKINGPYHIEARIPYDVLEKAIQAAEKQGVDYLDMRGECETVPDPTVRRRVDMRP